MEISRFPDLWQQSYPWQQLQLWHNLMLQSSGEKKAFWNSVTSGCPLSAVIYSEGYCCIPQIRSSSLSSAAIRVTGVASEKSHHPFITKSAAFLTQDLWMNASSKKLVIGVQCILKTGKTVWWQKKHCSWIFRSICALRINVCIHLWVYGTQDRDNLGGAEMCQ